jgi:hypothetical protein
MKQMILKTALLAAAALALPAAARAQPTASVVWTLNNFTFAGGATATGSFEWAPDTDQILSWDIVMSSNFFVDNARKSSPLRYSNVLSANSVTTNGGYLRFTGDNGWDSFSFGFGVIPTDLDFKSDSVNLTVTTAQFGETWNFIECVSGCGVARKSFDSKSAYLSSVSSVSVPEPETYALMLAGFALLGGAAHRKRARA